MRKIEYSKVVQRKLRALRNELTEKFGSETSTDTMTKVMRDIHHLRENSGIGAIEFFAVSSLDGKHDTYVV